MGLALPGQGRRCEVEGKSNVKLVWVLKYRALLPQSSLEKQEKGWECRALPCLEQELCWVGSRTFWQIGDYPKVIVQIPFTHKLTFFAKVQYIQSCNFTCGSELRALTSLLWLLASPAVSKIESRTPVLLLLCSFNPQTRDLQRQWWRKRYWGIGNPEFALPWCVDTSSQLTLTVKGADTTEEQMQRGDPCSC